MTEKFDQITATLPPELYADPIAPWRVDVLSGKVRLTTYRVIQPGPDEPRTFHTMTQLFASEQAVELVNALEQALAFVEPSVPLPSDSGAS